MDIHKLTYHTLEYLNEPWTFSTTLNTIKSASSHIMYDYDYTRDIFNKPDLIPFSNGCWNIVTQTFQEGIQKEDYQCSCLPFDYVLGVAKKTNDVAPKICAWLKDRVGGSEILTNVLMAVIFACILKIQYPQRFLFLTGHSSTGKSTFFLLLTKLMSEAGIYVISADDFSCDFGLEDLADGTRKDLIIFHDIGASVTQKFIDLLRTLVSSEGETNQKKVRRKHKKTGYLRFSGMVCAASNMSPFTGVQAQGIVDRRLLLVPFLKRVEQSEIKDFDLLFPAEEIQNLVRLSTHISPKQIKRFLLMANQHPELQEIALEHYEDRDEQSAMLQHYVNERITYQNRWLCALW